jgi:hypothetical protein
VGKGFHGLRPFLGSHCRQADGIINRITEGGQALGADVFSTLETNSYFFGENPIPSEFDGAELRPVGVAR